MFEFLRQFRRRSARRAAERFVRSGVDLVKAQFQRAECSPLDLCAQPWVMGYLFAAFSCILERAEFAETSPAVRKDQMLASYEAVFGYAAIAEQVFGLSVSYLHKQRQFAEGQLAAGLDFSASAQERGPHRLYDMLRSDFSEQQRQACRQKDIEALGGWIAYDSHCRQLQDSANN